jgi:cytosine/adenosine deaminase-related metal-dependent hydrolase
MSDSYAINANWTLIGPDLEPVRDATVIVEDGVIADITTRQQPAEFALGDVALIPGLVNAHTHLELSDLTQPLEQATPFTSWVRKLIGHRRTRTTSPVEAMLMGLEESKKAGVVAIGDILSGQALDEGKFPEAVFHASRGLYANYFYEVIGFKSSSIENALSQYSPFAVEQEDRRPVLEDFTIAVSPHAPYSVHPALIGELTDRSNLIAMHLSETRSELEFLDRQTGEFRQMLEDFGVWEEGVVAKGSKVLNYLEMLEGRRRVLVVHGNYLTDEELVYLSEFQHPDWSVMSVVYCPRTHAYFGHEEHRFREMLNMGINVCLGTDSRASNPDLSVYEEVKFLKRRYPDMDSRELIGMATWRGALALGLEKKLGTIEVGKQAKFAVVELGGREADDIDIRLLAEGSRARGL